MADDGRPTGEWGEDWVTSLCHVRQEDPDPCDCGFVGLWEFRWWYQWEPTPGRQRGDRAIRRERQIVQALESLVAMTDPDGAATGLSQVRLAWAELQGVPIEQVRAAFYYVRTGDLVVHDDLPDRVAIEAILGTSTLER